MTPSLPLSLRPMRLLPLLLLLGAVAAPAAMARDTAFLGISSRSLTGDDARRYELESRDGVIITRVYDGTGAEEAGLRRDDIVLEFDGHKVFDDSDLTEMIRDHYPDDEVTIGILRDGKPMTLTARLGTQDDWDDGGGWGGFVSGLFGGHRDRPSLGVHVMELNSQLAAYFNADEEPGILVTKVVRRSPAEEAGIQAGDVIVRVGGSRVLRSGEIGDALEGRSGETVSVQLLRRGDRKEFQVTLDD